jgi:hypothetical protein
VRFLRSIIRRVAETLAEITVRALALRIAAALT